MKSYFAIYKAGPSIEPVEATVLVFDKNLSIGFRKQDGSNEMLNWPLANVEAHYHPSTQQTRVTNTDSQQGHEFIVEGDDAAKFIQSLKTEQRKPWYQKKTGREWVRNSLLMMGILGALVFLYLLIVPWLSQQLAYKVSVSTEKQFGDAAYDAMGLSSQEDHARTLVVNDFFSAMEISTAYDIRISVVKSSIINAFALPGGRIVVYSGLLDQVETYPELAALLSHEFIHVDNKHATKSIFRRLGSKVFIGLLFGRFGSVTSVLANHADNIKSLKYSRRLEKEADIDGLQLLLNRKIDPDGFVQLFTHLQNSMPGNNTPEFLESHPDVQKRIDYIKEASKAAAVTEDVRLKAIFEQLKTK